jgi:hypothetical protein
MMVDSRLKAVHAGKSATDPEQQELMEQFLASLGPDGLDDLVDGACTLIYMFMTWLRKAHESEGKDVIEYVVPTLVATMRMMPRSCPPEVIPMMAGHRVPARGTHQPHRRQPGLRHPHDRGRADERACGGVEVPARGRELRTGHASMEAALSALTAESAESYASPSRLAPTHNHT